MSPIDAAWYRMDRPANPAVVTGIILLATPVDFGEIKDIFAERLLSFDRFRYRVVETGWPWTTPHWELDPHFDIDAHLSHLALPAPGNRQVLLDLVSDLATRKLDYRRPLWQAYVIDNVGDGTASVALAKHLLDPRPSSSSDDDSQLPPDMSSLPSYRSILERWRNTISTATSQGLRRLLHPVQTIGALPTLAEGMGIATWSVIQSADPPTPLRGDLTGLQRVAFSKPLSVESVKAAGAPLHATLNDVLVATMTGALRHYLLQQSTDPEQEQTTIRAVVPVDLRPPERALELGNAFGLTFLSLPVYAADPVERLRITKQSLDAIKRSPEAQVFLTILNLFGQLPRPLEDVASSLFASKATVVMTNVAGPSQQHTLGGQSVDNIVFWVPHPVSMGVGISILSYNGRVTLGVITDAGIVAEPEIITAQFDREIDALVKRLGSPPADVLSSSSATSGGH